MLGCLVNSTLVDRFAIPALYLLDNVLPGAVAFDHPDGRARIVKNKVVPVQKSAQGTTKERRLR